MNANEKPIDGLPIGHWIDEDSVTDEAKRDPNWRALAASCKGAIIESAATPPTIPTAESSLQVQ